MSRAAWFYGSIGSLGLLAAWRALRPRHLVLCYHNVVEAESESLGDAALHLPQDAFEAQLDWLDGRYAVCSLAQLLSTTGPTPVPDRPSVAITFDDAYVGVFRNALPVLRRRGFPATVFITNEASESGKAFWWDLVAGHFPQVDRASLRNRFGGRSNQILQAVGLSGSEMTLPDDYYPADWRALREAADDDLSYGAHTRTHPMLTRVSVDELPWELGGMEEISQRTAGNVFPVIAYPYGDTSDSVARAAKDLGYLGGVTTSGRRFLSSVDKLAIPRLNIPSKMPISSFASAASGIRRQPRV